MILSSRSLLLPVLAAVLLAGLPSCNESDQQKMERIEKAMENAKATLKTTSVIGDDQGKALKPELTADEKAAEDPSKKLILYIANDLKEPFQSYQADLMRQAVRTLDGYRFKALNAANDVGKQQDLLGSCQNQQPVWLLVAPVEERLSATVLEGMRNTVPHIIGLDPRLPETSCETTISTDQAKIGRLAGELTVSALRRKAADEKQPTVSGRVVQIRGAQNSFASKARAEAFEAALKAEPGIIIVHDAPGDWRREGGKARIEEARRLQGSFDVVFAHNDSMAQGASDALAVAQQRENVLIIGVDGVGGDDGGLEMLRRGVIDATIRQPMALEQAFALIQKSVTSGSFKLERRYSIEPVTVTPKNLDTFLRRSGK